MLSASGQGLVESLGGGRDYVEGENLTIDYQNARGDQANLQTMVNKLAGNNDINFAIATPAAQPLLNVDAETPTIFTSVTDPVSAGLVELPGEPWRQSDSLMSATDVEGQVEMLLKVVPDARQWEISTTCREVDFRSCRQNKLRRTLKGSRQNSCHQNGDHDQ